MNFKSVVFWIGSSNEHFVASGESDGDFFGFRRRQVHKWLPSFVLRVHKLERERVVPERHHEFERDFSERFAHADATAAQKGRECERFSFRASGCEVVGALAVEALWDEALWVLPLSGVAVHEVNHDEEGLALVEIHPVDADVSTELGSGGACSWSLDPHRLLVAHSDIVQILDIFVAHFTHDIVLDSVHKCIDFSHEFCVHLGVVQKRGDKVRCRDLHSL